MDLYFKTMESPVGRLTLTASAKGLSSVLWEDVTLKHLKADQENDLHPILVDTENQLNEYFAKKRKVFAIELDYEGTDFQKKVWQTLLTIPFSKTKTYGEVARLIGSPDAVRAVGGAEHNNPIAIIIPCHRVIGASGKLVGFGGGLANKTRLLNIEKTNIQLSLWGQD